MRLFFSLSVIVISSFLPLTRITPLHAATDETQHYHHNDAEIAGLRLNQGEKWQTDAPLRQGMQAINDAAMEAAHLFHRETFTQQDAEQLEKLINDQVTYLIANCKLDPKADATLHLLIGELLTSSNQLLADPLSHQGLPSIINTLRAYPIYFDHQGW